jgi:hypothetical protein
MFCFSLSTLPEIPAGISLLCADEVLVDSLDGNRVYVVVVCVYPFVEGTGLALTVVRHLPALARHDGAEIL